MSETRTQYNAKIIAEFRTNQGRIGGTWEEIPLLLLHHTGAKSGTSRVNPVAYLPNAPGYLIWAANGGAPNNPDWYHNLNAQPNTPNPARHRDDRRRGRGGDRRGARAPVHICNRTLPAARRSSAEDQPRHPHDRPHTPAERVSQSPAIMLDRVLASAAGPELSGHLGGPGVTSRRTRSTTSCSAAQATPTVRCDAHQRPIALSSDGVERGERVGTEPQAS